MTVKICMQRLLTQVNKVSLVRCRLLFSIIVIWLRKYNLFLARSCLQRQQSVACVWSRVKPAYRPLGILKLAIQRLLIRLT